MADKQTPEQWLANLSYPDRIALSHFQDCLDMNGKSLPSLEKCKEFENEDPKWPGLAESANRGYDLLVSYCIMFKPEFKKLLEDELMRMEINVKP